MQATYEVLQSALDGLSAHVAVLDDAGTIVLVNRAWRKFAAENGYRGLNSAVGQNYIAVCEAVTGEDRRHGVAVAAGLRDVIAGRREGFYHEYPCHSDGVERWFQLRVGRFTVQGRVHLVVSHENVTELKLTERRMRQLALEASHLSRLQTVGEMASQLAHELGQPLAAIGSYVGGCVNRFRSGQFDPEQILGALESALDQSRRAQLIIQSIRRFIRKTPGQREAVPINDLIVEAVRISEVETRPAGVRLHLALSEGLPPVHVDRILIEQVLLNLIRNAVEALREVEPHRRELTIASSLADGTVQVTVKDTGPGMTREQQQRLFEPFFTTKAAGVGLGASLSQSIVRDHGGRIDVFSEPGEGATFVVQLPARTP